MQPSAPPLPSNNTYLYVPAPGKTMFPLTPSFDKTPYYSYQYVVTIPPQQQDYKSQTNIQRSEGCLAGALTTLFCCCLIEQAEDM